MQDSNKRIAKNTIYLYLRTGINLLVTFFSMRLLLKYLGVEDFGLYGLVGSIVALVESIKGLLSSSIQRFINVELGKGLNENVNKVFCTGFRINCVCALAIALILELLGVILIPSLDIPPSQLSAALCVFHFSVATVVCTILYLPYEAIVVAYERFNVYALLSIAQVCLKLVAVLLLLLFSSGRIVAYAVFLLCVALVIGGCYIVYCGNTFPNDTKIRNYAHRSLIRQMASFAGWQFVGSCSSTVSGSCINFILNIFGGLAVNAARTIAYQVMTAVNVLVWNVNIGFTPQCISAYSAHNESRFYMLLYMQTKFTFFLSSTLGLLIAALAYPILRVWLGVVPPYAVNFVQVIFLYSIARSIHDPVSTIFSASGKQKTYQISKLMCMLLSLGMAYLLLMLGFAYWTALLVLALFEFMGVAIALIIARMNIGFDLVGYSHKVLTRCIAIIALFCILFALSRSLPFPTYIDIIGKAAIAVVGGVISYFILFNCDERSKFKELIFSRLKHHNPTIRE